MTSSVTRLAALLALCGALATLGGCITLTPPPRFLVVEDGVSSWKAVTPEDSRLWVRVFDDEDGGGLAFWQDALKADLVDNRGYVLVSEGEAKAGGVVGREYILETTVHGRPVRELLTLFVTSGLFADHVHVIEYVADKDAFEAELAAVRAAVATYSP